MQELLKAVVALKQLHKENRKLASNFDNVRAEGRARSQNACGLCIAGRAAQTLCFLCSRPLQLKSIHLELLNNYKQLEAAHANLKQERVRTALLSLAAQHSSVLLSCAGMRLLCQAVPVTDRRAAFCAVQVSVEQQYQQLCEAWKAELDEKQRQFEQARAQILEPRCATGSPLNVPAYVRRPSCTSTSSSRQGHSKAYCSRVLDASG